MICVLQFDAASVSLIERMLGAGDLPNLAAAIGRGRRVELETPAVDFAAGAFYSLYSGVPMGGHGIFYPFQWSAEEGRARYATAFPAPPPVWERLAGSGLRTLAIDPYESRPPARRGGADGVFVCGWGFTDRVVLPRWSHPRGTARPLERRFGRGPEATEVFGAPSPAHLLGLRERLLGAPARIASLARDQLAASRFDLAWLTFSAAHLAGHAFWDLSQLDAEALEPRVRETIAGALPEIYAEVDRAIGSVIEVLPEGSDVIVASAVGMEENTSRADLLPQMLGAVLSGEPLQEDDAPGGAIWKLRSAIPGDVRARVAAAIPRPLALELTSRLELRGHDWGSTRAFAHPADNQGYVRFNLGGRERHGIVAPGAEADELAALIAEGLSSFRLADGSPAVTGVVRIADMPEYAGAHADRLPDLVVRWSETPSGLGERLVSDRFGTAVRHGAGSGRSGNHPAGGAWAVLAPGSGATWQDPGRPARIEDVAATVCGLLGIDGERTAGMAGAPLLG